MPLPGDSNKADAIINSELAVKDADNSLSSDQTSFILRTTLIPQHREDPNVLGFIREYLLCRSVTQAAKACGLTKRDGENLRRRPDIHEAISQITEAAVLKHGYDASEIIERVKEIVNIDPADFENEDGSFKESLRDIPPESRRAVKRFKAKNLYGLDPNGMKVVIGKLIEVEFWDKLKSAELLGREKNTFKETKVHQHDITANMSNTLLESKKRAEAVREVGPPVPVIDVVATEVDDEV